VTGFLGPEALPRILDVLFRGTLLIGAALGVLALGRRLAPDFRHRLLLAALLSAPLLPILPRWAPHWDVDLIPRTMQPASPSSSERRDFPGWTSLVIPDEAAARTSVAGTLPEPPQRFRFPSPGVWIPWVWLLGAALGVLRLLAGALSVARLRRTARPLRDSNLQGLVGRLAPGRTIQLRVHPAVAVPMLAGWRRPVVLLPSTFANWSEERRRQVLTHEISHIRRGDVPAAQAAYLVSIIFWFHPIVWFALRRLYIERERACDDDVLAAGMKASDYAAHLLDIARGAGRAAWLSAVGVAMARKSSLEVRLVSILNRDSRLRKSDFVPAWLSVLALAALLVPLTGLRTLATPSNPPQKPRLAERIAPPVPPREPRPAARPALAPPPQEPPPAARPAPPPGIESPASGRHPAPPVPPAVVFAGQDDALAVRDQLSRFYAELTAQNYSEALGFFSDITQEELSRMLPLVILTNEKEARGKVFSMLVLPSRALESLRIESDVKAVSPDGDGYLVVESLTITRTDSEGRDHILVNNNDFEWRFIPVAGEWKIDRKHHDRGWVHIQMDNNRPAKKIGLCLSPKGIDLLQINGEFEDNLEFVQSVIKPGDKAARVHIKK
jgi:beta-lactamase regulating signal transducer with metallopeptidase domain